MKPALQPDECKMTDARERLARRLELSRGHWSGDDWGGSNGYGCQRFIPNLTDPERDMLIELLRANDEGAA